MAVPDDDGNREYHAAIIAIATKPLYDLQSRRKDSCELPERFNDAARAPARRRKTIFAAV